ncbi:MAG: hypothetical protein MN733_00890 [Nitrososphaera sp.]|nr:hypothetical protein [Nitrososphaera sp.]
MAIMVVVGMLGFTNGCYYASTTITRGKGLEEAALTRIVIGKTTQSDLFKLFGTPHSIFQGQQEFKESQAIGFWHLHPFTFYSYKEDRYLTTLRDDQYAILYRFSESAGQSLMLHGIVIGYQGTDMRIQADELLLFLNKETKIVEDAAYPKQSPAP